MPLSAHHSTTGPKDSVVINCTRAVRIPKRSSSMVDKYGGPGGRFTACSNPSMPPAVAASTSAFLSPFCGTIPPGEYCRLSVAFIAGCIHSFCRSWFYPVSARVIHVAHEHSQFPALSEFVYCFPATFIEGIVINNDKAAGYYFVVEMIQTNLR